MRRRSLPNQLLTSSLDLSHLILATTLLLGIQFVEVFIPFVEKAYLMIRRDPFSSLVAMVGMGHFYCLVFTSYIYFNSLHGTTLRTCYEWYCHLEEIVLFFFFLGLGGGCQREMRLIGVSLLLACFCLSFFQLVVKRILVFFFYR